MTAPRIAPLEPPYEPDTAALLAKWMPPGNDVEPLRLFRTLAVHDELASRMRPLGAGILGHPRPEPRERELLILRTCARAGAEYEWGVHAIAFGGPLGPEARDAHVAGVDGRLRRQVVDQAADRLEQRRPVASGKVGATVLCHRDRDVLFQGHGP